MTGDVLHFVVGISVVAVLLWGASRLTGRLSADMPRAGRPEALRVVGRRQVARGAAVVRVSVEDRDVLLGVSPKGVELLCELPKTQVQPVPARGTAVGDQPARPSFSQALARSLALRHERH